MAVVTYSFQKDSAGNITVTQDTQLENGDRIEFDPTETVHVVPKDSVVAMVAQVPMKISVDPEGTDGFLVSFQRSGGDLGSDTGGH